jgi:mitotic spindle assembly checkpoint protein MAD2
MGWHRASASTKDEKEVNREISAIMRQICSSVSFLPLLEEACTFDLLVYTPADCKAPPLWEDSDPRFITGNKSNEVRLRSFTTKVNTTHRTALCPLPSAEMNERSALHGPARRP